MSTSAEVRPQVGASMSPRSRRDLFLTFSWLAMQGFGGVLAVAQRELVDRKRWLTREEYLDIYSVAQILPGPNVVNFSLMFGDRFFGLSGALSSLCGMLLLPMILVLGLAAVYNEFSVIPEVAGAMRGMGAVAAGLMLAMAVKLLGALRHNPMGLWLCGALMLASFVAIAVMRLPLVWVVLALGVTGWCAARWCIARERMKS